MWLLLTWFPVVVVVAVVVVVVVVVVVRAGSEVAASGSSESYRETCTGTTAAFSWFSTIGDYWLLHVAWLYDCMWVVGCGYSVPSFITQRQEAATQAILVMPHTLLITFVEVTSSIKTRDCHPKSSGRTPSTCWISRWQRCYILLPTRRTRRCLHPSRNTFDCGFWVTLQMLRGCVQITSIRTI